MGAVGEVSIHSGYYEIDAEVGGLIRGWWKNVYISAYEF